MTELSFLLELLLNHKLPKVTKEAVTARVKLVEAQLHTSGPGRLASPPAAGSPAGFIPPHLVGQSASTIAAMMRHEAAGMPAVAMSAGSVETVSPIAVAPVSPVAVVAQTPATAAALADRQAAISSAVSGKPEKGRTSPRKF